MGWKEFFGFGYYDQPVQSNRGGRDLTKPEPVSILPAPPPPDNSVKKPKEQAKILTVRVDDVNGEFIEGTLITVGHKYTFGCIEQTLAWIESHKEDSPEVLPNTPLWGEVEDLVKAKITVARAEEEVLFLEERKATLETAVRDLQTQVDGLTSQWLEAQRKVNTPTVPEEADSPTITEGEEIPEGTTLEPPETKPKSVKRASESQNYDDLIINETHTEGFMPGIDMFDSPEPTGVVVNDEDISQTAMAFLQGQSRVAGLEEPPTVGSSKFVAGGRARERDTGLVGTVLEVKEDDDYAVLRLDDSELLQHIPLGDLENA